MSEKLVKSSPFEQSMQSGSRIDVGAYVEWLRDLGVEDVDRVAISYEDVIRVNADTPTFMGFFAGAGAPILTEKSNLGYLITWNFIDPRVPERTMRVIGFHQLDGLVSSGSLDVADMGCIQFVGVFPNGSRQVKVVNAAVVTIPEDIVTDTPALKRSYQRALSVGRAAPEQRPSRLDSDGHPVPFTIQRRAARPALPPVPAMSAGPARDATSVAKQPRKS